MYSIHSYDSFPSKPLRCICAVNCNKSLKRLLFVSFYNKLTVFDAWGPQLLIYSKFKSRNPSPEKWHQLFLIPIFCTLKNKRSSANIKYLKIRHVLLGRVLSHCMFEKREYSSLILSKLPYFSFTVIIVLYFDKSCRFSSIKKSNILFN